MEATGYKWGNVLVKQQGPDGFDLSGRREISFTRTSPTGTQEDQQYWEKLKEDLNEF